MYSDNLYADQLDDILPPQFFWCADCRKLWTYKPGAIQPNGELAPSIKERMVQLTERPCLDCGEDVRFNPFWVITRGIKKAKRRAGVSE